MSRCQSVKTWDVPAKKTGMKAVSHVSWRFSRYSKVQQKLAFQEVQTRILHLIATGASLGAILNALAKEIEALSQDARCSILLLNESGTTLYPVATPSFPPEYQHMLTQGLPVLPDSGTCGPAIYWKKPIGVEDVATHPLWDSCRQLVMPYGFRAYWSSPILDSKGEPMGTFGMVYRTPYTLNQQDQLLVKLSTHLASIAIERHRAETQLQALNARLEEQVQQHRFQLQQALSFEATLKRITDKVRDSLDEAQILQTTVEELAQTLGVSCSDAGIYSADHTASKIAYEYRQVDVPSAIGKVVEFAAFPDVYRQLLQGDHLQFSLLLGETSPRQKQKKFTILACPIRDDSGVLGDLWLLKPRESVFDDQEIRLVQQVANQCAIALRQARLYQASQAQVQELARVNQLKDDFLSTVSHELRTPIANMKMAIKLLSLSGIPEQRERYLNILCQECQRESDLINDLLDLQRLESACDSQALTDWVDLTAWIPSMVEPFVVRTQERQQGLQVRVMPDLPSGLWTHRSSLDRIVSELLNNACKYTSKGGCIELEVAKHPEKRTIQFQVRNEAAIPAVELPNLFKKFYRIPNADPWKQGGTGLGLALIQRLVEQLQGQLEVISQDGWTTFTVQFPH